MYWLLPVVANPEFVLLKFVSGISLNILSFSINELGDDSVNLLHALSHEFIVSFRSLLEFVLSFPEKHVFFFVLFLSILLKNSFCFYKFAGVSTGELKILSW